MDLTEHINYQRIETAIAYIRDHFKGQPNLDEVAEKIHLSPSHFQRLFQEWAGTSPKKFLQYISVEHAKHLLNEDRQLSLFDVTHETGLSSTSRLHDLFVTIEGMTPAEYKNGGKDLHINFDFSESPFGNVIVASTTKGICYMAFDSNAEKAVNDLKTKFPNASFRQQTDELQKNALKIFGHDWNYPEQVKLHLKGTDFQLKVWESLLKIPLGHLSTYGKIAEAIHQPTASRAVGTAIGSNPVAFLIPCHRVIQASGVFGGYMWGPTRKAALIGWEHAQIAPDEAL